MGVFVPAERVNALGTTQALVLAQIEYWLEKAQNGKSRFVIRRDGYAFLAKTRQQLCDETGLTIHQMRTALEGLRRKGLIHIEQHKFDNMVTSHIRLVETPQPKMGTSPHSKMGNSPHSLYSETILKTIEDCSAGFTDGNCEEKPMPPKSRIGLSVADVLAGKKTTVEKLVTPDKATKVGDLTMIFQKAWAEKYPDTFLPPLTGTQMGQLKHFLTRSPKGKAGLVLDHVTRHWQDFCGYAVARQAAFKLADRPSIPQMLQYLQSAVETWQEAQIKPHTALTKAKPLYTPPETQKTLPEAVIDDEDKPITLEELQKMMGLSDD